MSVELPFVPSNLVLPAELNGLSVEGDLYNICERIKEISPSLQINGFINPEYPYVIIERCIDGIDRVVMKAKVLDGRVLDHLRRLMSQPLSERLAEIERNERKFEQDEHERMHEDLFERVGLPMWHRLEKDGFIDQRPISYPKKGVKPTKS